jgi:hypothetical protein
MREDALANHTCDSRKQYPRGNKTRSAGREGRRLRCGFGGVLVNRGVVRERNVGSSIKRTFFWIDSYDSNSMRDRTSIATASASL